MPYARKGGAYAQLRAAMQGIRLKPNMDAPAFYLRVLAVMLSVDPWRCMPLKVHCEKKSDLVTLRARSDGGSLALVAATAGSDEVLQADSDVIEILDSEREDEVIVLH